MEELPADVFVHAHECDGGSRGAVEQAFDHHFELYSTGEFFSIQADPEERSPLRVSALQDEAAREGGSFCRQQCRLSQRLSTSQRSRADHVAIYSWIGKRPANARGQ